MQNHVPQPGERYRHFKNKQYQIITLAKHSETGEEMIVYQALYDDFEVYVRPLSMFMSEVDHQKYPEVQQTYRFEQITDMKPHAYRLGETSSETDIHPSLMAFLDAEDDEERYRIVSSMENIIDDHIIDTMAVVLDIVIEDGELEKRYQELKHCLKTRIHFEGKRLR